MNTMKRTTENRQTGLGWWGKKKNKKKYKGGRRNRKEEGGKRYKHIRKNNETMKEARSAVKSSGKKKDKK